MSQPAESWAAIELATEASCGGTSRFLGSRAEAAIRCSSAVEGAAPNPWQPVCDGGRDPPATVDALERGRQWAPMPAVCRRREKIEAVAKGMVGLPRG